MASEDHNLRLAKSTVIQQYVGFHNRIDWFSSQISCLIITFNEGAHSACRKHFCKIDFREVKETHTGGGNRSIAAAEILVSQNYV